MLQGLDHVSLQTTEYDRVVAVVRDVLGFEEAYTQVVERDAINELFGWTGGGPTVRTTHFGTPPGKVEVVDIPDAVAPPPTNGRPPVGILQVSVVVPDARAILDKARVHDVDSVTGPLRFERQGKAVLIGTIRVGGIQFEVKGPAES